MDKGSIDGIFWYGYILSYIQSFAEAFQYYQQAAKKGLLASIS
jgi:hypothetical protein